MNTVPDTGAKKPTVELEERDGYPLMVCFEQANGNCKAFCYRDMTRLRLFSGDFLQVRFTTAAVAVHGRTLLPAWQGLRTRRAKRLRVGNAGAGDLIRTDGEPHIDSIIVTPLPLKG